MSKKPAAPKPSPAKRARIQPQTKKLSEITGLTTLQERKAAVEKNLGETQALSTFLNGIGWR